MQIRLEFGQMFKNIQKRTFEVFASKRLLNGQTFTIWPKSPSSQP